MKTEDEAKVQETSLSAARGQSRDTDADSSFYHTNKTNRKPFSPFQETEPQSQDYSGLYRNERSHMSHQCEEMTAETLEGYKKICHVFISNDF